MVLTLEDYHKGDSCKIRTRSGDLMTHSISETFINSGPAATVFNGDTVVAIGGMVAVRTGVAKAWSFMSDTARGHGRDIVYIVHTMLPRMMKELGIHRLEATVRADRPEYIKFARMIGMHPESLMDMAAPDGSDMIMFTMLERES
ncbi:MAG: hypothetical protein DRP45_10415 [Candidatus Zixiibacteriota bacterium]|nr:MAG: hypothetical protein DRP45_10415 [candidate division Zixibacteria bacterium]